MELKTDTGNIDFKGIEQVFPEKVSLNIKEQKVEESEKKELDFKEIEKVNGSVWLERSSFRTVLLSTFTALSVVLGYALIFLPNIEVYTLMIFLTGFIMGKKDGALVGLMSSLIFCFFNPIGASPLPLLALQLTYYSLVGVCGGITSGFLNDKSFFKPKEDLYVFPIMLTLGIVAAIMTFTFDVFSTVILALSVFGTLDAFWPNYIFGIPFTAVHLVGNVLLFVFVLPSLIQLIYKLLDISKKGE